MPPLSSITRAIASSLTLTEVFARVAEACREALPFDRIWIARLERPDLARVFAVSGLRGPLAEQSVGKEVPRSHYSPRVWPAAGGAPVLVADAPRELDPAFAIDAAVIEGGMRSLLVVSLEGGAGQVGLLWLEAEARQAFDETHADAVRPIADLVALALEHDRLWRDEERRRLRGERLEALLPAIAGALDVRVVFPRMSAIIQEVVPHDVLSLALLTGDGRGVRIHASASFAVSDQEEYTFTSQHETIGANWSHFLVQDLSIPAEGFVRARVLPPGAQEPMDVDLRPGPFWTRMVSEIKVRSSLRVPIRTQERTIGALAFSSCQPSTYVEDDVPLAARIADHVALALSHERLADEVRRTAKVEERAAQLATRVDSLTRELAGLSPHRALGRSRPWRDALDQAAKVAPTETTVLITGESGTGKEVVARFLHRGSARKDAPFVALNCAALSDSLLESELFGHEKGAFTGALDGRPGKIEQASGGVLFLDEVGEMSPVVQAKFLRVLQEREYQRLGGSRTLKADVRVLAATNRDLKAAIAKGAFRDDLYYRLAVFEIPLPALRERPDDILVLAEAFVDEIGRSVGRPAAGLSLEVRETLASHPWPGNVRELRNALERAVILCEGGLITSEHLPIGITSARAGAVASDPPPVAAASPAPSSAASVPPAPGGGTLVAAERDMILNALVRAGNNKSKAARLLGLTRAQLRTRIEKHGLESES